jgi:hypothetical protein
MFLRIFLLLFLFLYQRKKYRKKEKTMFEGTESSIHILQYTSTQVFVFTRRRKKEKCNMITTNATKGKKSRVYIIHLNQIRPED